MDRHLRLLRGRGEAFAQPLALNVVILRFCRRKPEKILQFSTEVGDRQISLPVILSRRRCGHDPEVMSGMGVTRDDAFGRFHSPEEIRGNDPRSSLLVDRFFVDWKEAAADQVDGSNVAAL